MNKSCFNKTKPQETASGWKNHVVELSWLLGWVKAGYGWCSCHFIGRYRKGDNVAWGSDNGTNLIVVDIDGDTTLEKFWETDTAKDWCVATYTSSSHTDEEHRFRALFPLGKDLHAEAEHRGAYWLVVNRLCQELGLAELKDNCGQKAERLWYGNTRTTSQVNHGALVPDFLLNDIAHDDERVFNNDTSATELDVKRCKWLLENFLRPSDDGEYETYFTPVMAACASVGRDLADEWLGWVDRGHHGQKESNRSLSKWQGLGKSSYTKLYALAKQQDPDWKNKLPLELRWASQGALKGYTSSDPIPDYSTIAHAVGESNFIKAPANTVVADAPKDVDVDSMPGANSWSKGKSANSPEQKVKEEKANVETVKRLFKNLRLNTLTDQIEYENAYGKKVVIEGRRFDIMTTELAIEHDTYIRKEPLISAVTYVAMRNRFCPIKSYLDCCERTTTPHPDWHRVGEVFLGNVHPMATKCLQRLMIGAVARAYNPGCSMSWLPILIGKQGAGKSQFARSLAPDHLFAEISTPIEKLMNEPARLHNSWVIELPEIDYQFKTKNIEPFKNLITTRVDETRKPYARDPEKLQRRFVFIGTTNVNGLLVDSTGNRRFVPLEIGVEKDTETDGYVHRPDFTVPWQQLRKERDALWAAAIRDFHADKPYEFTSEEIEIISSYQKQFADPDPWEEAVVRYLSNKPDVSVIDILNKALDYGDKKDKITRRESKRVVDILQGLGWRKLKTNRKNEETGKVESLRLWRRPDNDPIDESHINYDF